MEITDYKSKTKTDTNRGPWLNELSFIREFTESYIIPNQEGTPLFKITDYIQKYSSSDEDRVTTLHVTITPKVEVPSHVMEGICQEIMGIFNMEIFGDLRDITREGNIMVCYGGPDNGSVIMGVVTPDNLYFDFHLM